MPGSAQCVLQSATCWHFSGFDGRWRRACLLKSPHQLTPHKVQTAALCPASHWHQLKATHQEGQPLLPADAA